MLFLQYRRGCRVLGGGESHYRWVSKTDTSDGGFYEPALAPHGIYLRGKAIWTLSFGLVTRNHRAGSFETVRGAALEGGSVVINCIKKMQKKLCHAVGGKRSL